MLLDKACIAAGDNVAFDAALLQLSASAAVGIEKGGNRNGPCIGEQYFAPFSSASLRVRCLYSTDAIPAHPNSTCKNLKSWQYSFSSSLDDEEEDEEEEDENEEDEDEVEDEDEDKEDEEWDDCAGETWLIAARG